MSATGKDTSTSSTPSFIAALVVGVITVAALSAVFVLLHNKFRAVYQPRLLLAPESKRPVELPKGIIPWWKTIFTTTDKEIIRNNGLDAYLFVRFIKIFGIYMLVPYSLLTLIILIPLAAVSPTNGETGLNRLAFGNVSDSKLDRHIGHWLVAIVLIFWTIYLIYREYAHFAIVRQEWLSSPQHLSLARTRTVQLVNVPPSYMSDAALRSLASSISGSASSVQAVWLARAPKGIKPLAKTFDDRNGEVTKLEGAEAKLLALAAKNNRKTTAPYNHKKETKRTYDAERGDLIDKYVAPKERPSWKMGFLGLIGEKHTLETSPPWIHTKNEEIEQMRATIMSDDQGPGAYGNVAWIRFAGQHEAHLFARKMGGGEGASAIGGKDAVKEFGSVYSSIEVVPEDIQWSNTSMSAAQRKIRTIVSWSLTIGLIIVWAIPVAFVGTISNIDALCSNVSWLAWLCKIPSAVLGIIKGILPPVLLAILFMLLPIVLRLWVTLQGVPRKSDIELKLFSRFWLFQVIHGFLIITLASGLIPALKNIKETTGQLPTLLATQLPKASIFFLTFILTTTFANAAKSYSRLVPSVMYLLRRFLAGNTPRKYYASYHKMDNFMWATTWPPYCLIICITIVYSVIQPIITPLALLACLFLYASYKYLLGWCNDQVDSFETGGLFYPKALNTVFVALYLEEICLAGLLFLSYSQHRESKSSLAGAILIIIMIVVTAAVQIWIGWKAFPKTSLLYSNDSLGFDPINGSTTKLNPLEHSATPPPDEVIATEDSQAGAQYGNTSGFHKHAFDHPALWKTQPIVWIADDELGIGRLEVHRIQKAGIKTSCAYARLDAEGNLAVERGPPDEAWYGGETA